MIGVRLPSRGSHVVRLDGVRCLLVVVALLAADAGRDQAPARAADSNPGSKTVDPFLEEDTAAPADDEIPAIPAMESPKKPREKPASKGDSKPDSKAEATPEVKSEPKPKSTPGTPPETAPKMQAPRVTREIRKTAVPRLDEEPDFGQEPDLPDKTPTRPSLPSAKKTPLGKSGWRSKTLEPAGAQEPEAPRAAGPKSESARFEPDADPADLSKPLVKIVIEGNKTIKTEEITKLLKTREGRVADQRQIKEDIRTLISKRWFFNVEPRVAQTPQGPVLIFKVVEKPVLQKVSYKGNKKIKEKELAELTGLKAGAGYDVGQNREAARRIESHYRDKGYLHAKVELEMGDSLEDREVVFKIDEGPKVVVTKITYKGNKFVDAAVLKQHVKTKKRFLWFFGGKYDPSTIPDDMQALRKYYQDLGFFDVKVTNREGVSDDKAHVHIEYVIDEGIRYKVRNIEFVGNRVLSEEKLREGMKVRPNDFFNDRFVTVDRDKVEGQYGELGRIFAKVEAHPRTFEEPGYVDLVYNIDEDRPYRIGEIHVHIDGDHPHTKETVILRSCTFAPGDLANPAKIKQSEQRLKNTQIFAGAMPGGAAAGGPGGGDPPKITPQYPDDFGPRRPRNLARGQSDVASRSSRPRARPARPAEPQVAVLPPLPTVPERPLDSEADLFGESLFAEAGPSSMPHSILRAQNAFDDEQPGNFAPGNPQEVLPADPFYPDDQNPEYIPYDIHVTETQTGRLSFGVGVNSTLGVLGNITLQENNFDIMRPPTSMQDIIDGTAWRGGGQQFRLEANPGLYLSRYLASWTDPYFLDRNVTLGVSGQYYNRYINNWIKTYWIETRTGGTVTLGRQFTPLLSGMVVAKAENVNINNPAFPTPADVTSVLGDNFLSTVKASLIHDTRDSFMLPGRGHYVAVGYEQGIANFTFPKADLQARQYFLVHERPDGGSRQVVALSGTVGWTGDQTPYFERFYAGSFATFRGFRPYGVSPRVNDFPIGGNFEFLGSAEYVYPVTADNMIQLVTFTDFGTVDRDVTLDAFRLSVGAGVRLTVPMLGPVPIGVDFAVPIMRQPFDQTQVISFSTTLVR
ncbi:MAG: POTRA domain-containing protein [Deltaproteobacteria bacterium]